MSMMNTMQHDENIMYAIVTLAFGQRPQKKGIKIYPMQDYSESIPCPPLNKYSAKHRQILIASE